MSLNVAKRMQMSQANGAFVSKLNVTASFQQLVASKYHRYLHKRIIIKNNNNNNNNDIKCCCLDTRCAFPCDKDVPCTLACCLFTCMVNGNLNPKCCAKVGDLTGESTKKVLPKK